MALVLVSVVAAVVETVDDLPREDHAGSSALVEAFAVAVMAVRVRPAPLGRARSEKPSDARALGARLHYATVVRRARSISSPCSRPWWPWSSPSLRMRSRVLQGAAAPQARPVTRRRSPCSAAVIRNESRALLATLLVVVILLVARGVRHVRPRARRRSPGRSRSIPHAMWWAIVTIATVGYGDMYPVTPVGRVFGGVVMVIGIAVFAVPGGHSGHGLRERDPQARLRRHLADGRERPAVRRAGRRADRRDRPAPQAPGGPRPVRRRPPRRPGGRHVLHHVRRGPGRHHRRLRSGWAAASTSARSPSSATRCARPP